jgi:glycosyltransferase involved in cell wall biosynthesis
VRRHPQQVYALSSLGAVLHNADHAADIRRGMMGVGAPSCVIVHHRSTGMATDASILATAIAAASPQARVRSLTLDAHLVNDYKTPIEIPAEVSATLPVDYLFLLEHAHANPPLLDGGFARHVVYVPNVEWLSPLDEQVIASGAINTVLLKTQFSRVVFSKLPGAKSVKDTIFTGWTSHDIRVPPENERSWANCVHVTGKSLQKNGNAIVALWMRKPDLPEMTVVSAVDAPIDLSMPLQASSNLRILFRPGEASLRALQRTAGIHVCPSIAEGFGHTLNEARSAGSVLLTTAGPPMDEMVEDGLSGILVPVRTENVAPFHRSTAYRVTEADLEQSIRRVLVMSNDERRQMGMRARRAYEEGREQFRFNVRRFIGA